MFGPKAGMVASVTMAARGREASTVLGFGTVVFSHPGRGWCLIHSSQVYSPVEDMLMIGVPCAGGGRNSRLGIGSTQVPAPGTFVAFLITVSGSAEFQGNVVRILGPMSLTPLRDIVHDFPWAVGVDPQAPPLPSRDAISDLALEVKEGVPQMLSGQGVDSCPGDILWQGPLGTAVGVSLLSSIVRGGPSSSIKAHALDGLIESDFLRLSEDSPFFNKTVKPSGDYSSIITRIAKTIGEGLGFIGDGDAFTEESKDNYLNEEWVQTNLKPVSSTQEGLFRIASYTGGLFDGRIEVVYAPKEEGIWESSKTPVVLSTDRNTFDGRRIIQVRDSLTLCRSPWIQAPRELSREEAVEIDNEVDPDFKEGLGLELDELSDYWGLLSSLRIKKNLEKRDMSPAREAKDKDDNPIFEILEEEEESDPGTISSEDVGYKTTGEVEEIPDPLGSDKESKLAALLSMIELGPEGSIILKDGWGSEIRMNRGNITVSPANDLHLRPGRDSFSLSPGHDIKIAGKDIENWSEEGSYRVKADKDLSLTAGASGKGMLLVENRATEGEDSGLLVRSRGEASFVSRKDMRIGITGPKGTDVGPDNKRAGTLWIDSGKGALHLSGNNVVLAGNTAVSMAVSSRDGACLSLSSSSIGAVAQSISMASSRVAFGGSVEGAVKGYEVEESGVKEIALASPSGNCNMEVGGSIRALKGVLIGESLQARSVSAEGVTASNGSFGNATKLSGLRGGRGQGPNITPPKIPSKSIEGALTSGKQAMETYSEKERAFGDRYINGVKPSFQDQVGYSSKGRYIIESAWQLDAKTAGDPLKHEPLKENWDGEGEDIHPWPGTEGWEDDKFVRSISSEGEPEEVGPLKDKYKCGKGL